MNGAIQTQTRCFACGAQHPHGLKLQFRLEEAGRVVSEWRPSADWEGFQGIIHGGVVTTVLDEAMSKAVASTGVPGLTCHLEVRLRKSVAPGDDLTVRAWVVETRKRRVRVEAVIQDGQGAEKAHGWATFLTPGSDPNGRGGLPRHDAEEALAAEEPVAR